MWFGTLDSEPREIGSLRVWRDEGLDMISRYSDWYVEHYRAMNWCFH